MIMAENNGSSRQMERHETRHQARQHNSRLRNRHWDWTKAEITQAIRTGIARDDTKLLQMPWQESLTLPEAKGILADRAF